MILQSRRCAIYTRKSSEEGLEQAFNSLDAQREACEAFIKSQAHEGWSLVKTGYDDGGFTGGNMDRPALKNLIADLKQGFLDVVVVYKVDRLTRSLADFAKIVEILDKHKASFVSVTQQFNTTSSMGRLTLNVLLSFAQFEREVTGERIRDKIVASKRRGMWMGGNAPLGYDVHERKLYANDREAEIVRDIFSRYLALKRVAALQVELRNRGIVSKVWISRKGKQGGGAPYSRGALYYLLRNPVYVGRVPHNGDSYPGQHSPILEQALWDKVQTQLAANRSGERSTPVSANRSPLEGLLFDDRGNVMTPSFTKKLNGQRYRYYLSQAILQNETDKVGSIGRVPAPAIERVVAETVKQALATPAEERNSWHVAPAKASIRDSIERIVVSNRALEIYLRTPPPKKFLIRGVFVRRGRGVVFERFDSNSSSAPRRPSIALVRALCRAHHWRQLVESGEICSYYQIARREKMNPGYVRRIMQLAFLSPTLVDAIIANRPVRCEGVVELTSKDIPLSWQQQDKLLRLIGG